MSDNEVEDFVIELEKKARSIKNENDRSKKYRAGVVALSQKAVALNDIRYLEEAVRFTDHIIDMNNRSRAFVDIIKGTAKIAQNTANIDLVRRSLELSDNSLGGLDTSHALEITASAFARVGMTMDDPAVIEESKKIADIIKYDTYRSMAWREIARTLNSMNDISGSLTAANKALDIIDSSNAISHMIYKASAYVDLSKLFLEMGHVGAAKECLIKARECAQSLDNEYDSSSIYQSIAEFQARMGVRIKDRISFEEAVDSLNKVTQEFYRSSTRQTLYNIFIGVDEKELIEQIYKNNNKNNKYQ